MPKIKRSAFSTLLATAMLVPTALHSTGLGDFNSFFNPGTFYRDMGLKPSGGVNILGGNIMVQGTITIQDENGKDVDVEVIKIIEYPKDGNVRNYFLGPRMGSPGENPEKKPMPANIEPQFAPVPLNRCQSSEPVLADGMEYYYYIRWCKKDGSSNPKKAKKNYYYMFANGGSQHVATLEFDCENQQDLAAMPPEVVVGWCQQP